MMNNLLICRHHVSFFISHEAASVFCRHFRAKETPGRYHNRASNDFPLRGTNIRQEHSPLRRHLRCRNFHLHFYQVHHIPHPSAIRLQTLQKTHGPEQQHYLSIESFHPHSVGGSKSLCSSFFRTSQSQEIYSKTIEKSNTFLSITPYFSTEKYVDPSDTAIFSGAIRELKNLEQRKMKNIGGVQFRRLYLVQHIV